MSILVNFLVLGLSVETGIALSDFIDVFKKLCGLTTGKVVSALVGALKLLHPSLVCMSTR